MFELLGPAISVSANVLLIWSGFRAWRIKNAFLKWSGVSLAAVLSTVATAASPAQLTWETVTTASNMEKMTAPLLMAEGPSELVVYAGKTRVRAGKTVRGIQGHG